MNNSETWKVVGPPKVNLSQVILVALQQRKQFGCSEDETGVAEGVKNVSEFSQEVKMLLKILCSFNQENDLSESYLLALLAASTASGALVNFHFHNFSPFTNFRRFLFLQKMRKAKFRRKNWRRR